MTDFKSAQELLTLCEQRQTKISEVMKLRECELGEIPMEQVIFRMQQALEIMRKSAITPAKMPTRSMGGLIGGEAKRLSVHRNKGKNICGDRKSVV